MHSCSTDTETVAPDDYPRRLPHAIITERLSVVVRGKRTWTPNANGSACGKLVPDRTASSTVKSLQSVEPPGRR